MAAPAMAYGMYPFCVHEEPTTQCLAFRRSVGPTEKDKTQRLTDAAESLQSLPDVAWYNATIAVATSSPLHVRPATLSVAWSIANHDVETHVRMVPVLLEWTRWTRDAPWQELRRSLTVSVNRPPAQPRHVRAAQIINFVGTRAHNRGESGPRVVTLCHSGCIFFDRKYTLVSAHTEYAGHGETAGGDGSRDGRHHRCHPSLLMSPSLEFVKRNMQQRLVEGLMHGLLDPRFQSLITEFYTLRDHLTLVQPDHLITAIRGLFGTVRTTVEDQHTLHQMRHTIGERVKKTTSTSEMHDLLQCTREVEDFVCGSGLQDAATVLFIFCSKLGLDGNSNAYLHATDVIHRLDDFLQLIGLHEVSILQLWENAVEDADQRKSLFDTVMAVVGAVQRDCVAPC